MLCARLAGRRGAAQNVSAVAEKEEGREMAHVAGVECKPESIPPQSLVACLINLATGE